MKKKPARNNGKTTAKVRQVPMTAKTATATANAAPLTSSLTDKGPDFKEQDQALATVLEQLKAESPATEESAESADQKGGTDTALPFDNEISEIFGKLGCYGVHTGLEYVNKRFLKRGLKPMSERQIALAGPATSTAIRKALDRYFPQVMSSNPELLALLGVWGIVWKENTCPLPPEPTASTAKQEQNKAENQQTTHEVKV